MTELTAYDWREKAKALHFRSQAFIDGRFVDAVSGETFELHQPRRRAFAHKSGSLRC